VGGRSEGDGAIRLHEVLQRLRGFLPEPLVLALVDHVGERPALDVGAHPGVDRGKARRALLRHDFCRDAAA
jgi:hypothetical protein